MSLNLSKTTPIILTCMDCGTEHLHWTITIDSQQDATILICLL